jgi:hypothetical protein
MADGNPLPPRFGTLVGALPPGGRMPPDDDGPFETLTPARDGFADVGGVKLWYAVWGDTGPWLAFAPHFQIVHSALLKAAVPYL